MMENRTKRLILPGMLFVLVCGAGDAHADSITGTVTVNASSTGKAVAGTYTDSEGKTATTSAADLAAAVAHADDYDGPTKFKATYTICLKPGTKELDQTKSTVTFETINYTSNGTETPSGFTTLAIKITKVTLDKDCKPTLFKFDSTDWYPNPAGDGIKNMGLSGCINIGGESNYKASYSDASNGALYTYDVKSIPEPATLALFAMSAFGLAVLRRRRA